MSGGLDILAIKEDDVTKMLAASVHLGDSNVNFQMDQYVYKVRPDGTAIINLKKTWEKLMLAARVIASIEDPADICIISNGTYGQRAVLKFAKYTGAVAVAGRFTPGTFTNQIQKAFREPRLLVVSDPITDHQPVTEASYVNIPVIAFCNTNAPLKFIDVAIPCNNNGKHSQGLIWWMLTREVLRLRGSISRDIPWDVVPDLYFYRDPEEVEKEEQAKAEQEQQIAQEWGGATITTETTGDEQWGDTTGGVGVGVGVGGGGGGGGGGGDWSTEGTGVGGISGGTTTTTTTTTKPPVPSGGFLTGDQDWNVGPTTTTKDWGADDAGGDWGNTDSSQVTHGNW